MPSASTLSRPVRVNRKKVQQFVRSLGLLVDLDEVVKEIAQGVRDLFGAPLILVVQLDPGGDDFVPGHGLGFEAGDLKEVGLARHGLLATWLVGNERCLELSEDLQLEERLDPEERALLRRLKVRCCMPLISSKRLIGIILLGSSDPSWRLSQSDKELLEMLAAHAALALENALLHSQQRDRLRRLYLDERLATAGKVATGVAHEVRNPLTVISSSVQYVLGTLPEDDSRRELLGEVLAEVRRINRTVEGLLNLSPVRESRQRRLDLLRPLEEALVLAEAQARQKGITIERSYGRDHFPVQGDPDQLKQIFLNLLLNASDATGGGGTIRVRVTARGSLYEAGPDRRVQIEISDTGCGIPAEELDRVFDPFFTTKPNGSGLGLAICQSLAERNGGQMDLESEVGLGTTVRLRFPLRD
jgi:signal transduction histidine kinase